VPTNLPPEASAAGKKYEEATTIEEKIQTLQVYLSKIPKHKGTSKLRLKLRRDLARFEDEIEKRAKHKKMITSGAKSPWSIEKHPGGVVALVGITNSGKSSLFNALTGGKSLVGDYEFTTNEPVIGTTKHEDVVFGVVDLPALVENSSSGKNNGRKVFGVIRSSSLILFVCDLTKDVDDQLKLLLQEFDQSHIKINEKKPPVKIQRTGGGGIHLFGQKYYKGDLEELKVLLRDSGLNNGTVTIFHEVDIEGVIDALDPRTVQKQAVVVGVKGDDKNTETQFMKLQKNWSHLFSVVGVSVHKNIGLDLLKKTLFENLGLMRIYTKEPGKKPTDDPLLLKSDSTVKAVCEAIHKSFVTTFRYARIFGASVKFEGTKVGLDHKLKDRDVVELRLT